MSRPPRIYLDNAATSWPKPEAVYLAVERFQREWGAPAGRSAYQEATEVSREVEAARSGVARWLGAADHRRIIFTANGTDALNLALHGILKSGNHVVTSVVEHNSVLRPLRHLEDGGIVQVTRVGCDSVGIVDADAIRSALRPNTRLIVLSHASNVTGALQPIAEVAALASERGVLFLVDAAQSIGHVPLDVQAVPVSLLAAPGHKGLLGPLGTGLLYVAPGVENVLEPLRQGGTGSRSDDDRQPDFLPDKYESGNLNALGILGLGAAVEWLAEQGIEKQRQHAQALTAQLLEGLQAMPGLTIHGPEESDRRVAVVSITAELYDPQELAAMLETVSRVQVRAGLHCAPLMHQALGTLASGGTVRFSPGPFNSPADIDATLAILGEILGHERSTLVQRRT